jgi:hypothetical protein
LRVENLLQHEVAVMQEELWRLRRDVYLVVEDVTVSMWQRLERCIVRQRLAYSLVRVLAIMLIRTATSAY